MIDNKLDRDRLIDLYILDSLDESDSKEFEDMMAADEELKDEIELMGQIVDSLRNQEENKEKMRRWEAQSALRVARYKWIKAISAVAACALLVIGFSYPLSYRALQDADFSDLALRGELADITVYWENEQYSQALESISEEEQWRESVLEKGEIDSERKIEYYKAELRYLHWAKIQTLLKMKEYDSAYEEVAEFRTDAGIYQKKADKLYRKLLIRTRL